jgi:hypothetical protein
MGHAARRSAEAYDIEKTSTQVEDRYRDLVARRTGRRPSRWEQAWRRLLDRAT